jgi:hypothetical protein
VQVPKWLPFLAQVRPPARMRESRRPWFFFRNRLPDIHGNRLRVRARSVNGNAEAPQQLRAECGGNEGDPTWLAVAADLQQAAAHRQPMPRPTPPPLSAALTRERPGGARACVTSPRRRSARRDPGACEPGAAPCRFASQRTGGRFTAADKVISGKISRGAACSL